MAASQQAIEKRQQVIKALKELKSTHSILEISQIIGVPFFTIRQIYARYCERIPLTAETKDRLFTNQNRGERHGEEVRGKVVALREEGLSFPQIGKKLNIPYNSAHTIYYREVNNSHKILETEPKELEKKVGINDKLVQKYLKEKQFHLTPLFFIRNHGVTIPTAGKICEQLKSLGAKDV